ncbi:tyrosine--tRNA ligase MSY1 [Aspergillus stella-maris]|uniref:tyrosine--tRNA ligase MSY1 n=1 Tax=Aspergillus stella-maris TaxID=1810926 RepID=UPI003CCCF588
MRPRPFSLPRAAHFRAPSAPTAFGRSLRSVCGARHYARTSEVMRTSTSRSNDCRPMPVLPASVTFQDQRRTITKQHLSRMAEAKEQWAMWSKDIKLGKRKSFVEHLEERGLIHDVVGERDLLHRIFTEKRVGIYAGVDPTAPSLHVGHMLPFMVLAWGYVWGLPVTFLLGGFTARVGDPTGRLKGREKVHSSLRKANMASMHMQLKKLGASIESYGESYGYKREWAWRRALMNNNTWWNKLTLLEVLRDLGAYMRLGPMLGRDTVKTRLAKGGDGMSFAEFTYPILQAWDWWTLFRQGCQVQVGGGDQYGNILFGMDAVKMISRETRMQEDYNPLYDDLDKPIGFTTPLLTTPSGEKFGKSAGNAIWLDKDMTSTFELYQFFVRTPDSDVERYLKMFTFIPIPKIAEIMEEQNQDPSKRVAQHALAYEFVHLIHGKNEAEAVAMQHRQLFRPRSSTAEPTPFSQLRPIARHPNAKTAEFINPAAGNEFAPQTNWANMPSARVTLPESLVINNTFNKVLWSAGLVSSKGEGVRLITGKGATVGSKPGLMKRQTGGDMPDELKFTPIKTWDAEKTQEFILEDNVMILKVGKWKMKIVQVVSDEEYRKLGLSAPGWEELEQFRKTKA